MLAGRFGKFARYEYEIERKYRLAAMPPELPERFQDLVDLYLPESSLRLRTVRSEDGRVTSRMLTQKRAAEWIEVTGEPTYSCGRMAFVAEGDRVAHECP